MTTVEAELRIREILTRMKNGEIRLIVRAGQVKYVNTLEEWVPDDPHDRGKGGIIKSEIDERSEKGASG